MKVDGGPEGGDALKAVVDATNHGQCRLCRQHRKLCQSHIVPEFCYKAAYDEKHRLLQINQDERGRSVIKTLQKGLREPLLCRKCEARINRYEREFANYWYGAHGLPRTVCLQYKGVQVDGCDFTSFKLFHLSVLWRASVSDLFDTVSLGPYEAKIRSMLLRSDPGPDDQFPILGFVLIHDDGSVVHPLVSEPCPSRFENSHVYYMSYAGCEWVFVVTDHANKKEAKLSRAIAKDGTVFLPYVRLQDSNTFKNYARNRRP